LVVVVHHHESLESTFFLFLICLTKQRAKQTSLHAFSGSGSNNREGNIGFHDHAKERNVEYMSTDDRLLKKRIAQEVLDATSASGARFLKKADANDRKKLGIPLEIEAWRSCPREGEASPPSESMGDSLARASLQ
jgi:hypothetical protein